MPESIEPTVDLHPTPATCLRQPVEFVEGPSTSPVDTGPNHRSVLAFAVIVRPASNPCPQARSGSPPMHRRTRGTLVSPTNRVMIVLGHVARRANKPLHRPKLPGRWTSPRGRVDQARDF